MVNVLYIVIIPKSEPKDSKQILYLSPSIKSQGHAQGLLTPRAVALDGEVGWVSLPWLQGSKGKTSYRERRWM